LYNNTNKTKILSSYLPDGKAFVSKNIPEKNLYKFLDAIAKSFVLYYNDLQEVLNEMNPETTEDLISRWEKEYGLPDQCLKKSYDLDIRRKNILIKIGMNGVQTIQDFIDLAKIFGYDVEIIPVAGMDQIRFPLQFPWIFSTEKAARFTIYVNLPIELGENVFPFIPTKFPFPFSSTNTNIVECVFKKLVPANVKVIFRYIL
jgi:uncharacterized protein YmfQ (DUF2313 family)